MGKVHPDNNAYKSFGYLYGLNLNFLRLAYKFFHFVGFATRRKGSFWWFYSRLKGV